MLLLDLLFNFLKCRYHGNPLSYGTYAALEIKSKYMQRWNRMTCKLFFKYSHFGQKNVLHRHIFSQLQYILWKNYIFYNAISQVLGLFRNNIKGNCTLCFSDVYVHVCVIYAYIYIAKQFSYLYVCFSA